MSKKITVWTIASFILMFIIYVVFAFVDTPGVYLNATSSANTTRDNLTAHITNLNTSLHYIYNWKRNITPENLFYLPMEGPNGTADDFSGYAHNGNVSQSRFNETAGYDGNGAYQFDGVNDKIRIDYNSRFNFTNSSFSVEARFYKKGEGTPQASAGVYNIVSQIKENLDATQGSFAIAVTNSLYPSIPNTLIFAVSDGAVFQTANLVNIQNNTWYHVIGVWDDSSGDVSLYVDGTLRNTNYGIVPSAFSTNQNISIGGLPNDATFLTSAFNGTIDDVRFYNHSLSAEEVMALFMNKANQTLSSRTQTGDNWTVQAWAFNSTGINGSRGESSVLINYSAPTILASEIVLNSTSKYNMTTDNLTFYNLTAVTGGIFTTFKLRWFHNSTVIDGLENNTKVTSGNLTAGGSWIAEIWPYDFSRYGIPLNSSPVVIKPNNNAICFNASLCKYSVVENCLGNINRTANSCNITGVGDYLIRGTYDYIFTSNANRKSINIASDNVSLDCNQSSLNGPGVGSNGFLLYIDPVKNVTVQNCKLGGSDYAAYANSGASNITFRHNTFNCTDESIHFQVVNDGMIYNNTVEEGGGCIYGFNVGDGITTIKNINISSNNIHGASLGVILNKVNNSFIQNNKFTSNDFENIRIMRDSGYNVISSNEFNGSLQGTIIFQALFTSTASFNNITLNRFFNISRFLINITLSGQSSNNIWLNSFYNGTIIDQGTGTSFCVNNLGNFYESALTPMAGDCGQVNISLPSEINDEYSEIINMTWRQQSSGDPISYHIDLLKPDIGWTTISTITSSDLLFDTRSYVDGQYELKVIPNDGIANGTINHTYFKIRNTASQQSTSGGGGSSAGGAGCNVGFHKDSSGRCISNDNLTLSNQSISSNQSIISNQSVDAIQPLLSADATINTIKSRINAMGTSLDYPLVGFSFLLLIWNYWSYRIEERRRRR